MKKRVPQLSAYTLVADLDVQFQREETLQRTHQCAMGSSNPGNTHMSVCACDEISHPSKRPVQTLRVVASD
ncbi:Hypothetical protein NTJ_00638 [Nesidiocoris tenuis]|uniref:Uncharacterized protein n=1 Tax=Nesidiocoris tenuis TaxID=355587 RepID=A0ABN7A7B5_9HEMI|nr:Hypothetical protein NTJ_00638 [Nesidiocoris tenuis]